METTQSHNVLKLTVEEGRSSCPTRVGFHNTSLTAGQTYDDEARRDGRAILTPPAWQSSHAASSWWCLLLAYMSVSYIFWKSINAAVSEGEAARWKQSCALGGSMRIRSLPRASSINCYKEMPKSGPAHPPHPLFPNATAANPHNSLEGPCWVRVRDTLKAHI